MRKRHPKEWLLLIALVVFISASIFIPLLQWLLPGNPLSTALAAVLAIFGGAYTGYELWDRLPIGRRRKVTGPAAPTGKVAYLESLIRRLSAEEDQYVPLTGEQAPFEGYDTDYTTDGHSELQQEYQDIGEALAALESNCQRQFVLIGAPGSGKTTTLRMLALAVARAHSQTGEERDPAIRALYDDDRPVPLPLWVNLGRADNPPDAKQLLHTWWSEVEMLDGNVMDAVRNHAVWLFLDGMNEMPEQPVSREERARNLQRLIEQDDFRNLRLIITCREHDYAGNLRMGFPVVRVRPLDDPRIEAFACHRLRSAAPGFLEALDAQPHLRELGRNPYTLVRFIAVYNENEPLPETLQELHERHTRIRYDHEKEHGRVSMPLPRLEKRLHRLAFRMIADGKGTSGDESWAQWRIGRRALDDAFQMNLLVANDRTGSFGFYHQTLHQFFALPGLTRRLNRGRIARQMRFIRQLGDLGEGAMPAVPVLVKSTQVSDESVMREAYVALRRIDETIFRRTWEQAGYPISAILRIPPVQRAALAREIANIDRRPGVGLRGDGLPDIAWLPINGTKAFVMRDNSGMTIGTFPIPRFYIAKNPITYRQFQAFIDNGGYDNDRWWRGLSRFTEPGVAEWPIANHPREMVNWYDAMAFCAWLSIQFGCEMTLAEWLATGYERIPYTGIRLPTEWEWQWAATGGDRRRKYPYEGGFDAAKGNTRETGIGQTSAVGIFPQGSAPCGALDMSGNVLEWCLNDYETLLNPNARDDTKSVRGGSWSQSAEDCLTTVRDLRPPFPRYRHYGFRITALLPSR